MEKQIETQTILTPSELVELIEAMLLVREGRVIDEATALERARNIATALIGTTIAEKE